MVVQACLNVHVLAAITRGYRSWRMPLSSTVRHASPRGLLNFTYTRAARTDVRASWQLMRRYTP